MKALADKTRLFREFAVGDMVFVRLQPYRQMSLKGHSYHKLSPKYFGLFQVLKKIGPFTYQLQLPPHARIHSTFHVSQLKKYVGSHPVIFYLPVSLSYHGHIVLDPERIFETRLVTKHNRQCQQYLVKWFNCPSEDSTWMDATTFKHQFPHF
ncbi:hypothetical protein A4A49_59403, partial [Nicotiana attenuata]